MKKFRLKVCGITRPPDAALCAELGADMIGLIFYRRSPRFVSQAKAREIVSSLPPVVNKVGVFVDEKIDRVLQVAERLRLDFVQLHGSEPAGEVAHLQKHGYKVIKSLHVRVKADYRQVLASRADLCLLDNRIDRLAGGTGQAFDWSLRPPRRISNLVLAGGITIDNVRRGVEQFDPVVVDVNSGVEDSPGVKSADRLRAFFEECDRIRYGY